MPKSAHKLPTSVLVGLILAIILDTGVQICWKMAVSHVPADANFVQTVICILKQPLFYGVIAMFLSQLYNWLKVLGDADLSFAHPITSLSYVTVLIFSAMLLHEMVAPLQVGGITLILVGVWFISQTDHNTSSAVEEF